MPTNCDHRFSVWPKSDQTQYNRKTRRRARKILAQLAGMVNFEVTTEPLSDNSILAQCYRMPTKLSRRSGKFSPYGCRSTIVVNKLHYDRLFNETKSVHDFTKSGNLLDASPQPISNGANILSRSWACAAERCIRQSRTTIRSLLSGSSISGGWIRIRSTTVRRNLH